MLYPSSLSLEDDLSYEKYLLHSLSGHLGMFTASSSSSPDASFSYSSESPSVSSQSESIKHTLSLSSSDKISQSDSNYIPALKEWAIVCKAAEDGKQVLLFRKGGIMEYRNGFELKHKYFFLFPTFEHQSVDSIRNEYKGELEGLENQHEINKDHKNFNLSDKNNNFDSTQNITNINLFVEVTYFNEIKDINKLEKLEKFHIWSLDYVKMRFNYNPKKPLYLMLLRTYKLNDAIKIHNKPEWSGCKSWIQINPEDNALENYFTHGLFQNFEYIKSISKPCIDDITFNKITEEVRSVIK